MAGEPAREPALELLAKSRRRVVGVKETLKRLAGHQVVAVFVAADASAALLDPVLKLAESQRVPWSRVDTMVELGRRCGIQVGAACAGVLVGESGSGDSSRGGQDANH
ncbi:MAG: ribosomal L7Ae/L30e/S12e/Gadd45 family protein [Thermaerobacter sp.]|nr:ribosomal L7Ae/L30e/S12e/Gadd45 family protein [Thermaerobacter sp.]